jgi:hypothetical protein
MAFFDSEFLISEINETIWKFGAAWGRGEMFTGFWLGSPKVRDNWEDLGIGGRITFRWTLGR